MAQRMSSLFSQEKMEQLADRLGALVFTASEKVKEVTEKTLNKDPLLVRQLKEATSDKNWGCATSILSEIARCSFNCTDFLLIMKFVWEALAEPPRKWRRIFKGLTLLDYLLRNGSERIVVEARENQFALRALQQFSYTEEGRDIGAGIREKAKIVCLLAMESELLKEAREAAQRNRNKFVGIGAHGERTGTVPFSSNSISSLTLQNSRNSSSAASISSQTLSENPSRSTNSSSSSGPGPPAADKSSSKRASRDEASSSYSNEEEEKTEPTRSARARGKPTRQPESQQEQKQEQQQQLGSSRAGVRGGLKKGREVGPSGEDKRERDHDEDDIGGGGRSRHNRHHQHHHARSVAGGGGASTAATTGSSSARVHREKKQSFSHHQPAPSTSALSNSRKNSTTADLLGLDESPMWPNAAASAFSHISSRTAAADGLQCLRPPPRAAGATAASVEAGGLLLSSNPGVTGSFTKDEDEWADFIAAAPAVNRAAARDGGNPGSLLTVEQINSSSSRLTNNKPLAAVRGNLPVDFFAAAATPQSTLDSNNTIMMPNNTAICSSNCCWPPSTTGSTVEKNTLAASSYPFTGTGSFDLLAGARHQQHAAAAAVPDKNPFSYTSSAASLQKNEEFTASMAQQQLNGRSSGPFPVLSGLSQQQQQPFLQHQQRAFFGAGAAAPNPPLSSVLPQQTVESIPAVTVGPFCNTTPTANVFATTGPSPALFPAVACAGRGSNSSGEQQLDLNQYASNVNRSTDLLSSAQQRKQALPSALQQQQPFDMLHLQQQQQQQRSFGAF